MGAVRSTATRPPAAPLTDGTVSLRYRRAPGLHAICAASHDPEIRRWLIDPPMDVGLVNVQFRDDPGNDRLFCLSWAPRPGVAPRPVRLVVDWAFSDLGLSEIQLEIDPENLASVRLAQKCGLEPAGRVHTCAG